MTSAAPKHLTVFGFGLIGASLALAAKARWPGLRVTAIDVQPVLDSAQAKATADARVSTDDGPARKRAFAEADLTVLAAPLHAMEDVLPEALAHASLVTDCGSTKRSLLAIAQGLANAGRFVAGHPMAGKPRGGIELADAKLFEGRPWIVCPGSASQEALARVQDFVCELGAVPALMSAEAHDRAAALTSHVPQVLASLLLVLAHRDQVPTAACGPGFDSATRVAGGAANIWRDILERNSDEIARCLEVLSRELDRFANELRARPAESAGVVALLEEARKLREKI